MPFDLQRERWRMREAAARGDATEFYRAKALVEVALHYPDREFGDKGRLTTRWDPKKHPRGMWGRFIDVLKTLRETIPHEGYINAPSGHLVSYRFGQYRVHEPKTKKVIAKGTTPEAVRRLLYPRKPTAAIVTPRVRVYDDSRVLAKRDTGPRR